MAVRFKGPLLDVDLCALGDIAPNTGLGAWAAGRQVATFKINDALYAISNRDPFSGTARLSRGRVSERFGRAIVTAPDSAQDFDLRTGECLTDPSVRIPVYRVRKLDGRVVISVPRP